MSSRNDKTKVQFAVQTVESPEDSRRAPSLKSPRTPRFAEATAVHSPIDPPRFNFDDPPTPTTHVMAQPQISDVGFGYINKHESVEMPDTGYNPPVTARTIPKSPLKSAMKTPGAPPRNFGDAIFSPTFKQEDILEKREKATEQRQARDIKVKVRVRMAKFLLRGVNFSCSLIVLSMLASTFAIFNATKLLPPRNNLPPWAANQKIWPQVTLLCIACVSLAASMFVFYGYWKGGHRRASKASVYYQLWAVAFFIFSIIMWVVGAAVLQHAKNNSNNKDIWGWSCVKNTRQQLFENDVSYQLICRLQNWSLVCAIIEIVVEVITIAVYAVVFARFLSKRKLRKSMAARDRARSELYVAQLRSQPNTPAVPSTPWGNGPSDHESSFENAAAIEEGEIRYIDADLKTSPTKPFKLQAPPTRATPKMAQVGFAPMSMPMASLTNPSESREALALSTREIDSSPYSSTNTTPDEFLTQRSPFLAHHNHHNHHNVQPPQTPGTARRLQMQQDHFAAVAPGETVYEDVPIPGGYEVPMSPGHFDGGNGVKMAFSPTVSRFQ